MNGYLSKSAKSEDFYPFGRMPKDMQVGLKTPESPIPIKSEGPLTVRVDPKNVREVMHALLPQEDASRREAAVIGGLAGGTAGGTLSLGIDAVLGKISNPNLKRAIVMALLGTAAGTGAGYKLAKPKQLIS
jgi:hypothetical protein